MAMSEKYDSGDGWVQNEEGDVIPLDGSESLSSPNPYVNDAELRREHPEYNKSIDDFDHEIGLPREQARKLNRQAEKDRGYRVTPKPDSVMELPGKDGRPTNWDRRRTS